MSTTENTKVSVNAPSNAQIAGAIEITKSSLQQQQASNTQLDETGKKLAGGAEKVISTAQEILYSANEDEKIQTFIRHLSEFGEKVKQQQQNMPNKEELSSDASKAKQNFQEMGSQLRELGRELLTSSEFRELLVQLIDIFDKLFSAFTNNVNVKDKLKEAVLSDSGNKQELEKHQQQLQHEVQEGVNNSSKQLSNEEKEELIKKLRSLLSKLNSHQAYKNSTESFLFLYDTFRNKQGNLDESLKSDINKLYREALDILREFIQHKDLHPLEDKCKKFYSYLDENHDINQYFQDFRKWTDDLINKPDTMKDSEVLDKGKHFINRGNEVFKDGKVHQLVNDITYELKDILQRFQGDMRAIRMRQGVQEMGQAFTESPFKAISQTRQLVVPIMKEFLKEIPLPRIEGKTDNGSTYVLDNMVLRGKEISLDDISLKFKFGLNDLITLVFDIKNIEATISNINFTYDSNGLFDWDDQGTLSCSASSPGWKIKWIVRETPNQPLRLHYDTSNAEIRKLNITIEQAKHKFLDKMITSLFSGLIKKRVQAEAETSLQRQAHIITDKLNQSFSQLQTKISSSAATSSS